MDLSHFEFDIPASMILKLETLQVTGSFKVRGVFNRLLIASSNGEIARVGVTAGGGISAVRAAAYAASRLGVPAVVFVPTHISPASQLELQQPRVDVRLSGETSLQAFSAAQRWSTRTGSLLIDIRENDDVIAGYATLAHELIEQVDGSLDILLVPVGYGGLLTGTCSVLGSSTRIVAVESEKYPALASALRAGRPVDIPVEPRSGDAIPDTYHISVRALAAAQKYCVASVLVSDDDVTQARQLLWEDTMIIADNHGATALAALVSTRYTPRPGETVGIVVSGANASADEIPA